MYFDSRIEAGKLLAEKLLPTYRYENCAVVALSDGGVLVASQIAMALHCVMTMLLTEPIHLPGEPDPLASINQDGGFSYNNMFSAGQIEGFSSDYHQHIEQERLQKLHKMNRLLGSGGLIRKDLLKGHNVILVSDGLNSGYSLDAAVNYLKPLTIEKLVVATPLASVQAVDRMHIMADEIYCLSVVENYMNTEHYYKDNNLPSHESIIKTIQDIVLLWH
jgi:putative phosphoribosyl transferase